MIERSAAPEPRHRPPGSDLRALVPLRPQGPLEVVDRATLVVRTRAADLLTVSAVVQLPIWLVLAVVLRDEWASGLADNGGVFWLAIFPDPLTLGYLFDEATASGPFAVVAARALPSIGLAFIGASCGHLVHDWARGIPTRGLDALARVARRAHVLLALWLIVHAFQVVLCLPGAVVGWFFLSVASPLWAIEGLGPWSTVVRSWKLSARRLGPLIVSIPVATFVSALVGGAIGAVGLAILAGVTGGWVDIGGTAATAMSAALPHLVLDPLLAVSMALIALDLKVQVEGYDLEVDLQDLAARGDADA